MAFKIIEKIKPVQASSSVTEIESTKSREKLTQLQNYIESVKADVIMFDPSYIAELEYDKEQKVELLIKIFQIQKKYIPLFKRICEFLQDQNYVLPGSSGNLIMKKFISDINNQNSDEEFKSGFVNGFLERQRLNKISNTILPDSYQENMLKVSTNKIYYPRYAYYFFTMLKNALK